MKASKRDLIHYRIARAYKTLEDTEILAGKSWNSAINRLYYAAYYAIMALLLPDELYPSTHTGAKSNFNQYFINTNLIDKEFGRIYSQLFTWRQKGDYDDLFDFDENRVVPYLEPVAKLLRVVEEYCQVIQ